MKIYKITQIEQDMPWSNVAYNAKEKIHRVGFVRNLPTAKNVVLNDLDTLEMLDIAKTESESFLIVHSAKDYNFRELRELHKNNVISTICQI